MGWLFRHGATKSSIIAEITKQRSEVLNDGTTVTRATLAKCVRGNTLYYVMEISRQKGDAVDVERFLGVSILSAHDGDWGSKDLEEDMGPCEAQCPPKYFKLVGPPQTEFAKEWRASCEAYAAKKARKVAIGDIWTLPGCTPRVVLIRTTKPLRADGPGLIRYRIRKRNLGCRFDPSWLTTDVRGIMRNIQMTLKEMDEDDRVRANLPFPQLADALEEAGCIEPEFLLGLRDHHSSEATYNVLVEACNLLPAEQMLDTFSYKEASK